MAARSTAHTLSRRDKSQRRARTRTGCVVLLMAAAAICPLAAPASAESSAGMIPQLEAAGTRLADEELDTLRGKYIRPDAISYFGISLGTSWQGPDGITTFANILFSVDFLKSGSTEGAVPQVHVSWARNGDPTMDINRFGSASEDNYVALVGGTDIIPVNGLGTVAGAVQSNVIAGTDNHTGNAMRISIVPVDAVNRAATNGMTPISGSESHVMADGDRIQFILEPSQIGLALDNAAEGADIRQSVDGNIGQIAQHVLINGSSNIIHNSADLTVGLSEMPSLDRIQADGALSAMKGRGF